MKIQFDTVAKTIKIEEAVNLGELTKTLNKLFPNGEWKTFKLEVNTTIVWSNPIVVNPWTVPVNPYPWVQPHQPYWLVSSGTTDSNGSYSNGNHSIGISGNLSVSGVNKPAESVYSVETIDMIFADLAPAPAGR